MKISLLKVLKTLLLALWVLLVPIQPALICILVLPLIDLLLGLINAIKHKEKITSAGLKRTVGKILVYEVATILAFVAETWLLGGMVPALKMVTALIGLTELKSCLEHLDELNGSPFFKDLVTKLAPNSLKDQEPPPDTSKDE